MPTPLAANPPSSFLPPPPPSPTTTPLVDFPEWSYNRFEGREEYWKRERDGGCVLSKQADSSADVLAAAAVVLVTEKGIACVLKTGGWDRGFPIQMRFTTPGINVVTPLAVCERVWGGEWLVCVWEDVSVSNNWIWEPALTKVGWTCREGGREWVGGCGATEAPLPPSRICLDW